MGEASRSVPELYGNHEPQRGKRARSYSISVQRAAALWTLRRDKLLARRRTPILLPLDVCVLYSLKHLSHWHQWRKSE